MLNLPEEGQLVDSFQSKNYQLEHLLVLTEEEKGLLELVPEDLRLQLVKRASVDVDQAMSGFAVGDCRGGLLSAKDLDRVDSVVEITAS